MPSIQVDSLRLLVASHAALDAEKAYFNEDRRLLGVFSVGLELPGFSEDPGSYPYGIRMIEGTSDVTCGEGERKLNGNAWEYASEYNQKMIILGSSRGEVSP